MRFCPGKIQKLRRRTFPGMGKSEGSPAIYQQGLNESSSRLLAALVNENLVHSEIQFPSSPDQPVLVTLSHEQHVQDAQYMISVPLVSNIRYDGKTYRVIPVVYPEDLLLPAILSSVSNTERGRWLEPNPFNLWSLIFPWFKAEQRLQKVIGDQISNSA